MAFTAADLDTIRKNIASGVLLTRFADGREIRYQSLDMLMAAERVISAQLTQAEQALKGAARRKFGSYRSGF